MMAAVNAHRKLAAWEYCMELTREIYRVARRFPAHERYGLTAQLQRAAVSTAANIAEGYARYGRQELAHGLSVSLGSLAEVDTLLEVASQLGYLSCAEHQRLCALRERASKATFGLQRKVRVRLSVPPCARAPVPAADQSHHPSTNHSCEGASLLSSHSVPSAVRAV